MNPKQRFGTGATEETVKTEGPGLARTFFNGMALAAGWMTVLGIIKVVKNSLEDDSEIETKRISDLEIEDDD